MITMKSLAIKFHVAVFSIFFLMLPSKAWSASGAKTLEITSDMSKSQVSEWVKAGTTSITSRGIHSIDNRTVSTYCNDKDDENWITFLCTRLSTYFDINRTSTYYPGSIHVVLDKTPATVDIDGADIQVDTVFDNMAIWFGILSSKGTESETIEGLRAERQTITSFTEDRLGIPSTETASGVAKDTSQWRAVRSYCSNMNLCAYSSGIVALMSADNGDYFGTTTGNIDVYVKLPLNLKAGTYTRKAELARLTQHNTVDSQTVTTYATLYANITITVPQRCTMTFPTSVHFDKITGLEKASDTPIQIKDAMFTSTCSNIGNINVTATLQLVPQNPHPTYSAAVFPSTNDALGIVASLTNNSLSCNETNNELFSTGSLFAKHQNNSTHEKNVKFGLCKYLNTILSPGTYTTSIEAIATYN